MANGSWIGEDFPAPYWVKVLVYIIQHLGMPLIVTTMIVAIFAGWVDSPLLKIQNELLLGERITHQLLNTNGTTIIRSANQIEELIYVNRAVCVNNAKTNQERERCLRRHE